MMNPLVLVDASIYVFRSYFSLPSTFVARNGEVVHAVYGFTQFLLDLIDRQPEYLSAAFDESLVSCYRNRIYPDYKANRDLPDENLKFQLAKCQEITALLGIHSLCLYDYEADDIIGTLHQKLGLAATIVTRDKDLGQLLGEGDNLWDFSADTYMGPDEVTAKFGVRPGQIADLLALAGDSVDNIPGAPGIGPKTAVALLDAFGSIEGIYDNLAQVSDLPIRGAVKSQRILDEHRDTIEMFKQITTIHTEIELAIALDELRITPCETERLLAFCDEMDFGKRVRERLERVGADGATR